MNNINHFWDKGISKGKTSLEEIKKYNPIVIPIVIDGFRRSFDKKGIRIKKRNILQSMEIKKPLDIDYKNDSIESIVEKIYLPDLVYGVSK